MKIVSLKDRRKSLTAVTLEDGSELLIDSEIVIIKNLAPDINIDDPDALVYESDLKRAKSRALWYLSRSDLSEKKLKEKLIQGGFQPAAVSAAVLRMKELGLINDERLAQRLYEYLSSTGASKREIIYKLQNKGIPFETVKNLAEEDTSDETIKIKKIIDTKYAAKLKGEDGTKKVFAALLRKGYSYSDVRSALNAYVDEQIEEEF